MLAWWALMLLIGLPLLVPSLVLIPPMWKLCGRAGFPRWFSFAMIVPLANLTLLYFIAFSQWPSDLRSVKAAGSEDSRVPPRPGPSSVTAIAASPRQDGG